MINVHRLNRNWRYLLIGTSVILVLAFLPIVLSGYFSDRYLYLSLSILIVGGLSGMLIYGSFTSKIITSPEGLESVSFGKHIKFSWDKVEKVEMKSNGFITFTTLVLSRDLAHNNKLSQVLGSGQQFELSPYIDDLPTNKLLEDLARYVPSNNIPKPVVENKRSTKDYQQVTPIALYYLFWLMLMLVIVILLRTSALYLESLGFSNITLISIMTSTSLLVGLFVNGIGLLGYSAETYNLDESEISHFAKTHYLSPFVTLLLGLVIASSIWIILQLFSIVLSDDNYGAYTIVAILIGAISLRVSAKIEKIIFEKRV